MVVGWDFENQEAPGDEVELPPFSAINMMIIFLTFLTCTLLLLALLGLCTVVYAFECPGTFFSMYMYMYPGSNLMLFLCVTEAQLTAFTVLVWLWLMFWFSILLLIDTANCLTLMMTSAQVVEMSVTVTDNSPFQDYPHPDDHTTQFTY